MGLLCTWNVSKEAQFRTGLVKHLSSGTTGWVTLYLSENGLPFVISRWRPKISGAAGFISVD